MLILVGVFKLFVANKVSCVLVNTRMAGVGVHHLVETTESSNLTFEAMILEHYFYLSAVPEVKLLSAT